MDDTKICPLMGAGPLGINTNCKGDHCAWAYGGTFALVSIARSLDSLDTGGVTTYEG